MRFLWIGSPVEFNLFVREIFLLLGRGRWLRNIFHRELLIFVQCYPNVKSELCHKGLRILNLGIKKAKSTGIHGYVVITPELRREWCMNKGRTMFAQVMDVLP